MITVRGREDGRFWRDDRFGVFGNCANGIEHPIGKGLNLWHPDFKTGLGPQSFEGPGRMLDSGLSSGVQGEGLYV
jgi:hypothetical protein